MSPVRAMLIGDDAEELSTVGVETTAAAVLSRPENATIWTMARLVEEDVKLTASEPVAFFFSKTRPDWVSGPVLSNDAIGVASHPVAAVMVWPSVSWSMKQSRR